MRWSEEQPGGSGRRRQGHSHLNGAEAVDHRQHRTAVRHAALPLLPTVHRLLQTSRTSFSHAKTRGNNTTTCVYALVGMQQRPYAPLARSILLTFPGFLSCHLHSVSTPQPTVKQHTHSATATGEHQWSTHETVKADTQNTMQAYVMWFWRLLALHNTAVQMGQGARLSPGFVALPAFTAALAPTSTCTRMAKDVVMNKTMG